jgi:hypothetical protein
MAGEETTDQGSVKAEYNSATTGLNMDNSINQVSKGALTYALNAGVENFDGNIVNYQNEQGNRFCLQFPTGYLLIGEHFINEQNKHVFFLANPSTGDSQIGYMDNNDCVYRTYIDAKCLNFNVKYPIHKIVHKITNCTTEVYWTDGFNPRRYLDLNNIPYKLAPTSQFCDPVYTDEVDCNQLKIQPNFEVPQLDVVDVISGGDLVAGVYQFAIQYADADGEAFTSYYSVTNPTPIANPPLTTPSFNYQVGKSIILNVSGLDSTGQFRYFNIAVIKTINDITSVELIGTYNIDAVTKRITYTGQSVSDIRLTITDIIEKSPYYEIAQDITVVQDVLVWDNLTSIDRLNYQQIANGVTLQWETWRIPATENYADELNATNLRGYMRDEVYAFEIVFLLKNGKQTDGFHIPGRRKTLSEFNYPDVPNTNPDFIGEPDYYLGSEGYSPYWKIYNTASVTGFSQGYTGDLKYKGPYQYGEFGYWESTEEYPCNETVWGELSGQKIRHHKFPDVLVSPILETKILSTPLNMVMGNDAVFPIGVKIDTTQVRQLIQSSSLTQEQKDDIVAYKIIRGNRGTNKSVIAKGILRNVNEYKREEETFYFPNYPYNDLREDPFLLSQNNAYLAECEAYRIVVKEAGDLEYTDCNTNKRTKRTGLKVDDSFEICSTSRPVMLSGSAFIAFAEYDVWFVERGTLQGLGISYFDYQNGYTEKWISGVLGGCCGSYTLNCEKGTEPIKRSPENGGGPGVLNKEFIRTVYPDVTCRTETPLPGIQSKPELGYRHIFNSPETSFGQPFLGDVLKLESVIFGGGKGHHVEVRENAKYRLLTEEAQRDALQASDGLASKTDPWSATAMFAAYQAYLTIYTNGITRKNYAYSYNSIADYNYSSEIPNNLGIKQRDLDIAQYIIPGVQSTGDTYNINNWQRESSVYLRTDIDKTALPLPDKTPSIAPGGVSLITDESRFTISEKNNCQAPARETPITVVSYYGSIKNIAPSQWGQIYSYETVDTGFQRNLSQQVTTTNSTIFGGDTFISRFAFKTKLPLFIDNRVNAPDDSDIFYDEIGNIAYPKYWHSARSILSNYLARGEVLYNIVSYKANNFDCPNSQEPKDNNPNRTFYDGYFYLFAYGIPNFYCETSYNTDLRQAFNNKEGDFWPHVSTGIPDDWVQESFVPIAQDNTYYYNVTFSKQNRENAFSNLPPDWEETLCFSNYPFRAIYSEAQSSSPDDRGNSWLTYRAISNFDFPQNYGKLVSLDGIQNKAVLARFENKSLLYNTMLTVQTSNPQAAYLGNDTLFRSAPPIDFAETDLGYVGSQNKMLLKIPQGQITVDAKRGQVFLVSGNGATDISAFGSGMNRFFTEHLAFEILDHFPKVNTDNHFNGIGMHGVFDSKFERVIISKLDYIPKTKDVKYDAAEQEFYIERVLNGNTVRRIIHVTDQEYFCNKSWTLSFNLNTKSWVSFHSYVPNWYIAENNFFYSGLNGCCEDLTAIAVNALPPTVITTTTYCWTCDKPGEPTTSSTTTVIIDCDIEGTVVGTYCDLAGNAIVTVPGTTTTTICQRPVPLIYSAFISGYTIDTFPEVVTSGSLEDACNGIEFLAEIPSSAVFTYSGFTIAITSFEIGGIVYLDSSLTDCTFVPDGWYYTEENIYGSKQVYHVVGGIITEIEICFCGTTTTTTTTLSIPICCGTFVSTGDGLFYLDVTTGTSIPVSVPSFSVGQYIALTADKFFSYDSSNIYDSDITLSPFTAVTGATTAYTGSLLGSVAISDTLLYAINADTEIVSVDLTTGPATVTTLFALTNVQSLSNLLYTISGRLIFVYQDAVTSDIKIVQYSDLTGTVELEIDITSSGLKPKGIVECNCNIYLIDENVVYLIDQTSPYPLVQVATTSLINILTAAQVSSCTLESFSPTTTTTTTTPP